MGDGGCAIVCSTCFSWLKCQWKANEEARIPQERREYSLPGGRPREKGGSGGSNGSDSKSDRGMKLPAGQTNPEYTYTMT